MRYAPEHNEVTRERILESAMRLFQELGIDAVGLARIMTDAGLTVGTFYTHFKSKEALLQEAMARSLQARHEELARSLRDGNVEKAVRSYLSPEHRDAPGGGCPVATLAPEIARHARATRVALTAHLEPSLDDIARCLSIQRGKEVSRADATAFFGLLVGTLQLARATSNSAESGAILQAGVGAALRLAR